MKSRWLALALFAGIAAATSWVYRAVGQFGFVNYDDYTFVLHNHHVTPGITLPGLQWAFRYQVPMWSPLAWISYMLDCRFFGVNPGPMHITNLVCHLFAAGMLFLFLIRATGNRVAAALVTALFALHPLHVESVAWIAERRDVLSASFWFLTLLAWIKFGRTGRWRWYGAALLAFVAGMMSKPTVLTMPAILLIVDFWPLGRTFTRRLLYEKIPFALISVAGSAITIFGPRNFGVDKLPFDLRVENAFNTIWIYLYRMIWPLHLSVTYPFPASIPLWQPILSILAIAAISWAAFRTRHTAPWLLAGWAWYLVALIPVLGFVQTGEQGSADHYVYIPLVGIYIALSWTVAGSRALRVAALAAIVLLAGVSGQLTETWRNTDALWSHAMAVDPSNYMVWIRLGKRHMEKKHYEDALAAFKTAAQLRPGYGAIYACLAGLYDTMDRRGEAADAWEHAIRLQPEAGFFVASYGMTLFNMGRRLEALEKIDQGIAITPENAEIHAALGEMLLSNRGTEAGLAEIHRAIALDPMYGLYPRLIGEYWQSRGPDAIGKAIEAYREAVEADPLDSASHVSLGDALYTLPDKRLEAIREIETAYRLNADPELLKKLNQMRNQSR